MKFKSIFTRKKFYLLVSIVIIGTISVLIINCHIKSYSDEYVKFTVNKVPHSYTALVLGAKVYKSGRLSAVLFDRVTTAIKLYREKKVQKFLLSGDHGTKSYDEVNTMRKYLLENGIPGDDIFMDHAGFNTYSSMVRAKKVFRADDVIVVTQEFHIHRSLYIARKVGLNAYGMVADRRLYKYRYSYTVRESLARVKAFFDVVLNRSPKYLGKVIPITGKGTASWD